MRNTAPLDYEMFMIFNSLRSSDAICQHIPGSTFAQLIICYLTAPSHYPNLCWLVMSEVYFGIQLRASSQEMLKIYILQTSVKMTNLRIQPHLPGTNELTLSMREPSYLGLIKFYIMAADALASCIARTSAATILTTEYAEWVGPCLTWGMISTTYVISMWRNDIKCKYMFLFPLKNCTI